MTAATQTLPLPARFADLPGLLLTLLALLVAYKLGVPQPPPPVTSLPTALCDLQRENCRLTLPGNLTVDLKIADRPAVPNQTFVLEAATNDERIRLIKLEMQGLDVEMSGAPIAFDAFGAGFFRTRAGFPVCTVRRMTWQMNVGLTVDNQHLNWPLRFQTESGG